MKLNKNDLEEGDYYDADDFPSNFIQYQKIALDRAVEYYKKMLDL